MHSAVEWVHVLLARLPRPGVQRGAHDGAPLLLPPRRGVPRRPRGYAGIPRREGEVGCIMCHWVHVTSIKARSKVYQISAEIQKVWRGGTLNMLQLSTGRAWCLFGRFWAVSCENNQLVSSSKLNGLPSSKCKKAKEKEGDSSSVKGELKSFIIDMKKHKIYSLKLCIYVESLFHIMQKCTVYKRTLCASSL